MRFRMSVQGKMETENGDSIHFAPFRFDAAHREKSIVSPFFQVPILQAWGGKCVRGEPVAARFEAGEGKFAGTFPRLEDELAGLTAGGAYFRPSRSPDRADACVWALRELLPSRRAEPRTRML